MNQQINDTHWNAWLLVVKECHKLGYRHSSPKYRDLPAQEAICKFIRNLKGKNHDSEKQQ